MKNIVVLVVLFTSTAPALLCDLGLINQQYSAKCYIVGAIGLVVCSFILFLVGTHRVFSNFLLFLGISLWVLLGTYIWYVYMYDNQHFTKDTFDSPGVAFAGVAGLVCIGLGWLLHSFLNTGVAIKQDYKNFKENQKEKHDPRGLR